MIGPDEQFRLPVSVFTAEAAIKEVKLEVQTDARFTAVGSSSTTLAFTRPEEKLGFLALKSGSKLGKGKIRVIATSGKFRAESEVWLEVRTPNVSQTRFERATLAPGASWNSTLKGFGLDGTQVATLEVSALPPVNLDGRMQYLIHYPHGCLEQTTSGVFPQLYLPALIKLTQNQRLQVENNVRAGIARLRTMQHTSGGFAYWPGVWSTDPALELAQRLGHDLRRAFHARSREGGLHPARRHEVRLGAFPEGTRAALDAAQLRMAGRESRGAHRGRALCTGVPAVHAGAGGAAGDRRHESPARVDARTRSASAGCWPRRTSWPASRTWPTSSRSKIGCRPSCSPSPIRTPSARCCAIAPWC